jgi:hypothetical protein
VSISMPVGISSGMPPFRVIAVTYSSLSANMSGFSVDENLPAVTAMMGLGFDMVLLGALNKKKPCL